MALIACPECAKEISDKAAACPHCGNPRHAKPLQVATDRGQTVTIEATGKDQKAAYLWGVVMFFGGLILVAFEFFTVGLFFVIFGAIIAVRAKMQAWWRHG